MINQSASTVGPGRSRVASASQHLLREDSNPLQFRKQVNCGNLGDVVLRTLDQSDYDRVSLFQRELEENRSIFWGNTKRFYAEWWVDWAMKVVREKTAVISVGDVSGRIAGAATITPDYETADGGGELRLIVTPWAERNGLGRALTGNVLEKAPLIFSRVRLYVHRDNLTAQKIYKEHGFVECGGGIAALRMVCELR